MQKIARTFLMYYLPAIIWMGVIFYLSSFSGSPRHGEFELYELLLRKGAHVVEYFVLTILLFRIVWRYDFKMPIRAFIATAMFTILYAVTDELHQLLVPYREGKLSDIGIDCIGIGIALLILYLLYRINRRISASA